MNAALPVTPNRSHHRQRKLTHKPGIDMTPMVDLGFLLIAFFVMTTELSKPRALDIAMPKDGPPADLAKSDAITVLTGPGNSIYYYHGSFEEALSGSTIMGTDLSPSGLRKIIREKQLALDLSGRAEGRAGMMLLIKPGSGSTYNNLVKVLDEIIITDVKKYAILKITPAEEKILD